MLSNLLAWLWGRTQERRRYPRRTGGFRAWYASEAGWTPLHALNISPGGVGFVASTKFEEGELNFRLLLDEVAVLVRAKPVWCLAGTYHGKPVWRYGAQYTGVGADDWDAIVRFCGNQSVQVENKAQKELDLVRMQADDVERLIPARLQARMLEMLVEARRLAPLEKDKIPLVQYFYAGAVKHGGRLMHRLSIRSRVMDDVEGQPRSYDTRFLFDESGTDIEMESR